MVNGCCEDAVFSRNSKLHCVTRSLRQKYLHWVPTALPCVDSERDRFNALVCVRSALTSKGSHSSPRKSPAEPRPQPKVRTNDLWQSLPFRPNGQSKWSKWSFATSLQTTQPLFLRGPQDRRPSLPDYTAIVPQSTTSDLDTIQQP